MNSQVDASRAFAGRYRLLEFVGEGSNARVYLAEDLTLQRQVSLKLIRADLGTDEQFVERFQDEMRATSAQGRPRVLPVYDWGIDPQPFVVTEHLTGGSLAALLEAGQRLTRSQALMVGLEAARALARIHASGRAHLHLTTGNILFDSSARPYISDLGLAAALTQAGAPATAQTPPDTAESPTDTADAADETAEAAEAADTAEPSESTEAHIYSAAEQAKDVADLAAILSEAVIGSRIALAGPATEQSGSDLDLLPLTQLGPLRSVLERASTGELTERLSASELASELLNAAPLLPRPDPIALRAPEAAHSAEPVAVADPSEHLAQGQSVSQRSAIPHDDVPRRRWPGLLLAAVLVCAGGFFGVRAWLESDPLSVDVPDLQGQTRADAGAAAAEPGWQIDEIQVREPGTVAGEIVDTDPPAGTALDDGDTLTLFVSLGEPLISVAELDRLYGLTIADAVSELAVLGLIFGDERRVNDEVVPIGNVVGLDVRAGVFELEVGSEVDLLISKGSINPRIPVMPEGAEANSVVARLRELRLVPQIVTEYSDEVPAGAVIALRPSGGITVNANTTVVVRVSRGPAPRLQGAEAVIEEVQANQSDDAAG